MSTVKACAHAVAAQHHRHLSRPRLEAHVAQDVRAAVVLDGCLRRRACQRPAGPLPSAADVRPCRSGLHRPSACPAASTLPSCSTVTFLSLALVAVDEPCRAPRPPASGLPFERQETARRCGGLPVGHAGHRPRRAAAAWVLHQQHADLQPLLLAVLSRPAGAALSARWMAAASQPMRSLAHRRGGTARAEHALCRSSAPAPGSRTR